MARWWLARRITHRGSARQFSFMWAVQAQAAGSRHFYDQTLAAFWQRRFRTASVAQMAGKVDCATFQALAPLRMASASCSAIKAANSPHSQAAQDLVVASALLCHQNFERRNFQEDVPHDTVGHRSKVRNDKL